MPATAVRVSLVLLVALSFAGVSAEGDKSEPEKRIGYLFSAYDLSSTSFAKQWAELIPGLVERFPGLWLTEAKALHITVIYVGEFRLDDLPIIEELRLGDLQLAESMAIRAGVLGRKNDVVGLDLIGMDSQLTSWIRNAKMKLNDLALKKPVPDRDMHYRPHITLAYLRPDADPKELERFFSWVADEFDTSSLTDSHEALPYRWMVAESDYRVEGEVYISTDALRQRIATRQ
jgi:2'-5' RNA ligase